MGPPVVVAQALDMDIAYAFHNMLTIAKAVRLPLAVNRVEMFRDSFFIRC
jgi:hypothetical protein